MTRRISAVAVCCSRASAKRVSRSRTLEPSFFLDFAVTGSLASTLGFLDFAPRRIGPSLLLLGPYDRAAIGDRLGEGSRVSKANGWVWTVPGSARKTGDSGGRP